MSDIYYTHTQNYHLEVRFPIVLFTEYIRNLYNLIYLLFYCTVHCTVVHLLVLGVFLTELVALVNEI